MRQVRCPMFAAVGVGLLVLGCGQNTPLVETGPNAVAAKDVTNLGLVWI